MFDRAASRLGWCGLIALWVLVAPGFWAGSARAGSLAAGNPTVSFVPVGTCVKPGAVCTLQVVVDAAVDSLSCMELYIRYDTASAECTTALEGACYKGSGYPTFFRWEKVSPDTVSAVDCVLGYRSFFRAPGEIARFVFKAKKTGLCTVSFASVRLWDINRVELMPIAGQHTVIPVCEPTGDDGPRAGAAAHLANHPNPFNPSTVITLALPSVNGRSVTSDVELGVYSVSGAKVRELFAGKLNSGEHGFFWDGRDGRGAVVAAGIYFGVAETARGVLKDKMVLIR